MKAKLVNEALTDVFQPKPKKEIIEETYPLYAKIFNELFPDNKDQYTIEEIGGYPQARVVFSVGDTHFLFKIYKEEYPKLYMVQNRPGERVGVFKLLSKVSTADEVKELVNQYKDKKL